MRGSDGADGGRNGCRAFYRTVRDDRRPSGRRRGPLLAAVAALAPLVLLMTGCTQGPIASLTANSSASIGPDRDGDGLSDADEERFLTDPDDPDTDDDGCPDGNDIAPIVDSISSCARPPSNANENANSSGSGNSNASDNVNADPDPGGGPMGDGHCPFIDGEGLATEPGSGATTLVIAYGSDSGSARVTLGLQTFTLGPGGSQVEMFDECPDTLVLDSITFDSGDGQLQTFINTSFVRGEDYACGQVVTVSLATACNIQLSVQ